MKLASRAVRSPHSQICENPGRSPAFPRLPRGHPVDGLRCSVVPQPGPCCFRRHLGDKRASQHPGAPACQHRAPSGQVDLPSASHILPQLARAAAATAAAIVLLISPTSFGTAALASDSTPTPEQQARASQAPRISFTAPTPAEVLSASPVITPSLEVVEGNNRFTSVDDAQLPPLPPEFPPLPELRLPKYSTAVLPNGLKVFLLVDHEVPLIRGSLVMRGGQYASPADKVGVASLTAAVQRSGGSIAHPTPSLDLRLDELAASIEMGAGSQSLSADFECLVEDTEEVMRLFSEIVRTPVMPDEKLQLTKSQIRNILDHQYDSPASVSGRLLRQNLYGKDSIYARQPTQAQIASLTIQDLNDFRKQWQRPDSALLGLVGDFEPQAMLATVQSIFGDWAPAPGSPAQPLTLPVVKLIPPRQDAGTIYLVDRPGLTQASVAMAEPGIMLTDPDNYALEVLGSVLNSFGGVLFDQIRSRQGLAYSVSGAWDSPLDHQGWFAAGGETSSPGEFLLALKKALNDATLVPPPLAAVEAAKAETLNSFVFNFASLPAQLQRILAYELLGLPQDFLFEYVKGIQSITPEAVQEAAQRHLHTDQQTVVVTADAQIARSSLAAVGFRAKPLAIPPI